MITQVIIAHLVASIIVDVFVFWLLSKLNIIKR